MEDRQADEERQVTYGIDSTDCYETLAEAIHHGGGTITVTVVQIDKARSPR